MTEQHPLLRSVRAARALEDGHTRDELRGQPWEHRSHGLVRPSADDADAQTVALSDALGLLTGDSVIGGWGALRLQGHTWFDGLDRAGVLRTVLILCSPRSQLRQRPGITPFRGLVHPDEVLHLEGFSVATMARAVFDEMRAASGVREAVVALDLATSTTMRMPHTSLAAVEHVISSHFKVRGLVQARAALVLGSTRSASPWETRTRLLAELDADVPRLRVNIPLFDHGGRLLGIADLLDEDAGLVIESDGGDHRENVRHTDDNRREERFERSGLVVCRVTSLDHQDRWGTVRRIAAARRDALSTTRREWTTDKPDWWATWPPARQWD